MATDLSTLMGVAPYAGAFLTGQSNAISNDTERMRQAELEQLISSRQGQEQRLQGREPFELDKLRLGNDTTSAQLPGVRALSDLQRTNADKAAGTLQSDIAAKNFSNEDEMLKSLASQFGVYGKQLESVSDVEKPAAFASLLARSGAPKHLQDALVQQFSKVPPAQLSSQLSQVGEAMLAANPEFARTELQTSAGLIQHREQIEANKQIAQAGLDSGRYDRKKIEEAGADYWEKQVAKAQGARGRHAAAVAAASWFLQNGISEKAQQYTAMAEQLRPQAEREIAAMNPKPGEVNVGAVAGVPTNQPESIAPPQAGASAPAADKPQSLSDLQKLYPGVPPAKLKEAFKKKFGVDLK